MYSSCSYYSENVQGWNIISNEFDKHNEKNIFNPNRKPVLNMLLCVETFEQ